MKTLFLFILCICVGSVFAQHFHNLTSNYEEKIVKHYYSENDTQKINIVNFYAPLVDFRYYKDEYCHFVFMGDYKRFEDRTKDNCNTPKPKRALEISENLKIKICQSLNEIVIIKQPLLSSNDSIIVANEFRKIKLSLASFDTSYKYFDYTISDELYKILEQFPADEHLFIDSFSYKAEGGVGPFNKGMLKCFVINLKERKIKYYKMVLFGIEFYGKVPSNGTIRRVLKPYVKHLKKVNKLHTLEK